MAKSKVLPKKIGGVKIPKRLRKLGDEALSNPMMREIVAGALIAIGTALATRGAQKGSSLRQAVEHPTDSARSARHLTSGAASEMAGVAGGVAHLIEGLVDYLTGNAPSRKPGKSKSRKPAKHADRQRKREERTARGDMH